MMRGSEEELINQLMSPNVDMNLINSISKIQNELLTNTLKKMNKFKEDINIRRDLKLYEQDFNFVNNITKRS